MNFTTIEQSKHLLELGLSPDSADMKLNYDYNEHRNVEIPMMVTFKNWDDPYNKAIPCWSVGALLELMPLSIIGWNNETYTRYFVGNCAEYITGTNRYDKTLISIPSDSMIKCIYSMVCWLLQNDYIKTKQS